MPVRPMLSKEEPHESALLKEYEVCESIIENLDRMNGIYQSVFLAGSLAATAFVLQNPTFAKFLVLWGMSALVLIGLLFLFRRSRKIADACKDEMVWIEKKLHLNLTSRLRNVKGTRQLTIYAIIIIVYVMMLGCLTIVEYYEPALVQAIHA